MFNVWRLVKVIALLCPCFCQSSGRTGRTDLLKWWAACNHRPAFEHYLFQSIICFHAPSRSQRTLQTCFSTGINPHSSHTNLHRSTSSHLNLSPVWVSMGWESNRRKEIEAKLLRLPYECPDWFPIDVPVPWTKTWNFITVAVQFMCEPSFGFLGRWPPLL